MRPMNGVRWKVWLTPLNLEGIGGGGREIGAVESGMGSPENKVMCVWGAMGDSDGHHRPPFWEGNGPVFLRPAPGQHKAAFLPRGQSPGAGLITISSTNIKFLSFSDSFILGMNLKGRPNEGVTGPGRQQVGGRASEQERGGEGAEFGPPASFLSLVEGAKCRARSQHFCRPRVSPISQTRRLRPREKGDTFPRGRRQRSLAESIPALG